MFAAPELAAAMVPMHDTPLGPLADGLTLRQIGLHGPDAGDGLRIPVGRWRSAGAAPDIRLSHVGELLRAHLPKDDPLASYADRLTGAALGGQSLKGYLSGSVDAVLRVGDRYVVVDYKTNWLGDPIRAADGGGLRPAAAGRGDAAFGLSAAGVAVQRCAAQVPAVAAARLRPGQHIWAACMYLFLRGMCGPDTPVVDGHPAGVFSWQPPAALITAMSDLLDDGRAAA